MTTLPSANTWGMAFEARAMENIATAPLSRSERIAARWVGGFFFVAFVCAAPFASRRLAEVNGFLPAVLSAGVIMLALTSALLYVQYRIVRQTQLGLITIAYTFLTVMSAVYISVFPHVFSEGGLLHAGTQTAAWIYTVYQTLFGAILIAYAIVDRSGVVFDRGAVRRVAVGVTLYVIVALTWIFAFPSHLPVLVEGNSTATLWNRVIAPLTVGEYVVAALLLARGSIQTVAGVWLLVVAVARVVEVSVNGVLSGSRFTFGWYFGKFDGLIGSSIILAVFLFKINDLLLRLAARNRALSERTESAAVEIQQGELRYRSLANAVPQLIWTTDRHGVIDYVNDRWVAFTGYALADLGVNGWRKALDPLQPLWIRDQWQTSVRTGEPFSAEYRLREGATGRYRWFLVNAVPMRGSDGEIVRWIGSCTDIDIAKRIEEREAFLARAGERLASSLDMHATLTAIKNMVVPRLAAWCRVDMLDDEGRFIPMAVGSDDVEEEIALRALLGRPVESPVHELLVETLSTGEPIDRAQGAPFASPAEGVRDGNAFVVALRSGDVPLGTLTLVLTDGRTFDVDDRVLIRDFTRRAAQALEHARLYERERSTADALQRAMLPQVLPQLDHIKFSASYSAASESQRVGGDFYDAFTLPDGRVALTIGDVTGHGLEAAVIMGEIRQALRASSFERAEPSTILDRASRLLVASGRTVFVTAIFGVLDTETGRFSYATAGHPAPLVYSAGTIVRLQSSGLPIGLRDDEGVDFSVNLPSPCTLVMFTDGLLEFTRDIDDAERRIEMAIAELGAREIDHFAGAVMQEVLGDDAPSDDIAILTATVAEFPNRPPGERREWRFDSRDARTGTLVRHEIGRLIAEWTARDDAGFASELSFGELFSNAVRHAPGQIDVIATCDEGSAAITVDDAGRGFDGAVPPAEPFAETGRGLELIRALADRMSVESAPNGGTRVTVVFSIDQRTSV